MRGLEHGTSDAEQKMSSDVKPQAYLKPPKEIGDSGIDKSEPPRELDSSASFQPNSCYEIDGDKHYTDDNGKLYCTNKDLIPNNTFEKNGYTYKTDDIGRTESVEGQLYLNPDSEHSKIKGATINDIGKGDEKESDERGHIIGNRFNGYGGIGNLIPQDITLNRGEFNQFEDMLKNEVVQNKDVYVAYNIQYSDESFRPDSLRVIYTIDGEKNYREFLNAPGGEP